MSFSFAILINGRCQLIGSPMKKSFIRTLCISAILVGSISTSSDDPSQPCLDCPEDVYVVGYRSCSAEEEIQKGFGWRTAGWNEVPSVDWRCENLIGCGTGKCKNCRAHVEIQLSVACTPDVEAVIKTPAYGFFLKYADPYTEALLYEYLDPALPVIESL